MYAGGCWPDPSAKGFKKGWWPQAVFPLRRRPEGASFLDGLGSYSHIKFGLVLALPHQPCLCATAAHHKIHADTLYKRMRKALGEAMAVRNMGPTGFHNSVVCHFSYFRKDQHNNGRARDAQGVGSMSLIAWIMSPRCNRYPEADTLGPWCAWRLLLADVDVRACTKSHV